MGNLTHTVSGDIASFRSAARVPIESLKCHFKPKQDLHGYDKPWPGGGGKNLFNSTMVNGNIDMTAGTISSSNTNRLISDFIFLLAGTYTFSLKESKQVTIYFYTSADTTTYVQEERLSSWEDVPRTFTISANRYAIFVLRNSDNSNIIASDVSELQIEVGSSKTSYVPYSNICPIEGWDSCEIYRTQNLWDGQYEVGYINSSGQEVTGSSTRRSVGYIPVKPSSQIQIIYTKHPNNRSNIQIFQYKADKTYNNRSTWMAPNGTYNMHANTAYIRFTMDTNYTSIYTKGNLVIFYPSQKTTIPITFPAIGKNLYQADLTNVDIAYNASNLERSIYKTGLKNGTYTLSATAITSGETVEYSINYGYLENNIITVVDSFIIPNTDTAYNRTITVNNNQELLIINTSSSIPSFKADLQKYYIQIERGTAATSYEPYNSNNTVYGGYVDIAKGELVSTWNCYTITGEETFYDGGNGWISAFVPSGLQASNELLLRNIGYCTHYPYGAYKKGKIGVMYNERTITFDGTIQTAEEWKTYCQIEYNNGTPIKLYYPLKDNFSITPLSKTELKTFLDQNNIWSNTNDITEVSYQIHDSALIHTIKQKIIAAEQPHKIHIVNEEEVDITLATPKIEGLKLYFNPIYKGTGTPSGTNIYDLRPWGSISIYIDEQRFDKSLMQTYPCSGYYDYDSGVLYYDQIMQTLDGSTGITSYSNRGSSSIFWGYMGNLKIYNSPEKTLLSNMFTWAGYNYNYDKVPDWSFAGSSTYPNSFWMKVPNNVLSELSLNGAKTWLSNNPVKVIAPRKDGAVTTNIGSMDINVTRGIHNFNTINVWAPIQMEFNYWTHDYSNLYTGNNLSFTRLFKIEQNLPLGKYLFSAVVTSADTDSTVCNIRFMTVNDECAMTVDPKHIERSTNGESHSTFINCISPVDHIYLYASSSYPKSENDIANFNNIRIIRIG